MTPGEILDRALHPEVGAITITEERNGRLLGAASYRHTEDGVKLCNIVALERGRGIGTTLFQRVMAAASDGRMWCKAVPEAFGFYLAMGMKPAETLPDGRQVFRTEYPQAGVV